jgi:hypothetical protein
MMKRVSATAAASVVSSLKANSCRKMATLTKLSWQDPLLLNDQLTDEEKMIWVSPSTHLFLTCIPHFLLGISESLF